MRSKRERAVGRALDDHVTANELELAMKADPVRGTLSIVAQLAATVGLTTEGPLETTTARIEIGDSKSGVALPTSCAREFTRLVEQSPKDAFEKLKCMSKFGK